MFVLYIFVGLIVLLLIISALMPKKYSIEKTTFIKKPVSVVMSYVGDFNRYPLWNPWIQMEPNANTTISSAPNTIGHRYEWQGKKIGVGNMTLRNIDTKHINIEISFLRPWKSIAKDNWLFEPWGDGNETKVTWQNNGELPWPMARIMGPMIRKNLSHQFETGLNNLKKVCEGG